MWKKCSAKMTKYLIFDSGALINMAENCLISVLRSLQVVFQGEFILTPSVVYETIERPLRIKRFEWGAMRIQGLVDEGVVKDYQVEDLVTPEELKKRTQEIMNKGNNCLFAGNKPIHLIEEGESETMALASLLNDKGIDCMAVIDERTARMMCESPKSLKELMQNKLAIRLEMKEENFKEFQNIKVMRSAELAYMAFKKKLINNDKRYLEAILYAIKFGGCSISEKEILMMKNL